jgi:V8-like Glu-specific endopeptidase
VKARILAAGLAVLTILPATAAASAGAHRAAEASRQSRTSGVAIAAGNVYIWSSHGSEYHGTGCTISFAVRSKHTGGLGSLTAGHCVATMADPPAYLVHQTQSLNGNDTAPGDLLGKVTRSKYTLGDNGDSAFVALARGRDARPFVFTGGPSSRTAIPVVGLKDPQQDMPVCYSGATTGEHCGFTVVGYGPHTVTFKSTDGTVKIGNEWTATGSHCTSRKGDSGSPVYEVDGGVAYAVGILSGGQVKTGQCPFYFTPVSLALKLYHLTLVTNQA